MFFHVSPVLPGVSNPFFVSFRQGGDKNMLWRHLALNPSSLDEQHSALLKIDISKFFLGWYNIKDTCLDKPMTFWLFQCVGVSLSENEIVRMRFSYFRWAFNINFEPGACVMCKIPRGGIYVHSGMATPAMNFLWLETELDLDACIPREETFSEISPVVIVWSWEWAHWDSPWINVCCQWFMPCTGLQTSPQIIQG